MKKIREEEPKEKEQLSYKKEEKFTEEYYFRILNENRYILLYDEINNCSADLICSKLRAMNKLDKKSPIYIEINSGGGSVTDGIAIIDTMQDIECPVYTIIIGEAFSMAAMISIMGDKKFITSNSCWGQHSTADMVAGFIEHIKDRVNFLAKYEKKMEKMITDKTNLNKRQITQIRNGELWLLPDEALKYGVVDKIIYPKKKEIR